MNMKFKNGLAVVLTGLIAGASTLSAAPASKASEGPFVVYSDKGARSNHFVPSGWMGDYGDLQIDEGSKDTPQSGSTCIKVTYSGEAKQGANWAGTYWQTPPNNWGDKPGGYDLTGYKKLVFWARGAKGGEKVAEFKMGGIAGEHGDSDSASVGPLQLTTKWQEYSIDLTGHNLSHIIGGFVWAANRDDNPNGFTIYLDNIRYEK